MGYWRYLCESIEKSVVLMTNSKGRKTEYCRGKRGTTLVEVCIALALIAIASAMVASFCALTIGNVKIYKGYDQLENEFFACEKALDEFVSQYDKSEYTFDVKGKGTEQQVLVVKQDETEKDAFVLSDKVQLFYISGMTVKIIPAGIEEYYGKQLIICTLTYSINDKEGSLVLIKAKRSGVQSGVQNDQET